MSYGIRCRHCGYQEAEHEIDPKNFPEDDRPCDMYKEREEEAKQVIEMSKKGCHCHFNIPETITILGKSYDVCGSCMVPLQKKFRENVFEFKKEKMFNKEQLEVIEDVLDILSYKPALANKKT